MDLFEPEVIGPGLGRTSLIAATVGGGFSYADEVLAEVDDAAEFADGSPEPDEMALYDHVLSPERILAHYNAGIGA